MFKKNLKIAWRNIRGSKLYSIINIFGLSVGMAVSFLLLIFVYYEFSYDRFNVNAERIYLTFKNQPANGQVKTKPLSPEPFAALMKKEYPEVELAARTNAMDNSLVALNDKDQGLKANVIAADSTIVDIFSFDFIYGNKQNALTGQASIVLTESLAEALFGKVNPLSKVVTFNNEFPLTVTGVIKDLPDNSSLSFRAMISWGSYMFQKPWMKDAGWGNFMYSTWVMLRPGASAATVNGKIANIAEKYDATNKDIKLFLYPLTDLHLYNEFQNGYNSGGRIEYVRLFLILAISILLVACINFMNLSTARSEKRAREVGIRKVIGARRAGLITQFLMESVMMALLSMLFSIVFLLILLPFFNGLTGGNLQFPYDQPQAWALALGITVFTGIIAGSYPAFYLSSFNPITVLKGKLINLKATIKPRQVLVVVQFAFATALILASLFIYKQVNYIKDRPIGYDRNGLVEIPVDGKLQPQFESFRRDLLEAGAVTDAAITSASITSNTASAWGVIWPGQQPGEDQLPIDCIGVTWNFTNTYGLKVLQGRDFDRGRPSDSSGVLLNESAVKLMRLKEPLGREITWLGGKRTVVGIVEDFVWGSPYEPVKPAIIGFMPDWVSNIGLRLNPRNSISKSIAALENVYKKYNPQYPFDYKFVDENFSKKFADEKLLGTVSFSFTLLAIFISCLGLFGLSSFSIEQRRKELGIRKVLGASTAGLWFKLSKEFVRLVLISFLIGAAVGWYYVYQWLNKYTYHTSFDIWVFVVTVFLSIMICLLAVSLQAFRAARANPVKSLRTE